MSFLLVLTIALSLSPATDARPPFPSPVTADSTACRVDAETGRPVCCRVCSRGKACGNSCISRRYTCRVGRGCACNAGETSRAPSYRASPARASTAPRGMTRDDVRELQSQLSRLGYYRGRIDGVYGAGTRSAVRSFQRAERLADDGVAGPATRARLRRRL